MYDIRVTSRPEDSVWSVVRRGLSGIDVLGLAEVELATKHNIKPNKN